MTALSSTEIRHKSAILSTFPWMSDFILQPGEEVSNDPAHTVFLEKMQNLERQIYTGSHSREAIDVLQAMVVIQPGKKSFPEAADVSQPTAAKLSAVISAYRLIDVLYSLRSPSTPSQNPRHARLPRAGLLPSDKYWPLDDWIHTLEEGRLNLNELERFRAAAPVPDSSHNLLSTPMKDLSLQAVLFKALYGFSKQSKGMNMLYNLQAAAFHLSFMLKGYTANEKLEIPNIPDSYDTLYNATVAESVTLTVEEKTHLGKFLEGKELVKLRHPLNSALLFSPLYLLAGRKMLNSSWDQSRMLRLSKAFGNDKPNVLQRIELDLWRALLEVATGRGTIFQSLGRFFAGLPQDELLDLTTDEREFYSIGNSPKLPYMSLTSFLLCVEGETSLRAEWPLSQLRPAVEQSFSSATAPSTSTSSEKGVGQPMDEGLESDGSQNMSVDEKDAGDKQEDNAMDVDGQPPKKKARLIKPPSTGSPRRSHRLQEKSSTKGETDGETEGGNGRKRPPRPNTRRDRHAAKRPVIPFQQISQGSYLQPIEVEDYKYEMKVTFEPSVERERVRGEEFSIVDPYGVPHLWQPEFHFQADLKKFEAFKDLVQSCNAPNGQPRYLEEGYQSGIEVVPYAEYKRLSASEVQSKLSLRHLVITDMPMEQDGAPIKFDEEGLQELTNLDSKIHIQDQSIPVVDGDLTKQLRIGTLEHILEMARDPNGAIINGLSFPLPLSAIKKDKLCSDIEAWRLTEGLPFCTDKAVYPTSDMRWGLASMRGSRHWVHIDCDGLATFIELLCGGKLWILFRPDVDNEPDPSAHIDLFLNDFDTSTAVKTWDAEAVYLTPGTRLIMKPNTPHAVFTTEHSIALGGHFYSFANLHDTVSGIIHCFAIDNIVTNTEHPETRVLLFRMMEYLVKFYIKGADGKKNRAVHVPDLMNFASLVNVFSLCNYCMLANVLDYNTYQFPLSKGRKPTTSELRLRTRYDYNALSPVKRQYFTYARGLATNFINWLHAHYMLIPSDHLGEPEDETSQALAEVAALFLAQQAYAILHYKRKAEEQKLPGVPNCKAADVQRQLELLFEDMNTQFDIEAVPNVDSFAFRDYSWRVCKRAVPLPYEYEDPSDLGTTKGDEMFMEGTESAFPMGKSLEISKRRVSDGSVDDRDGQEGLKRKRRAS